MRERLEHLREGCRALGKTQESGVCPETSGMVQTGRDSTCGEGRGFHVGLDLVRSVSEEGTYYLIKVC